MFISTPRDIRSLIPVPSPSFNIDKTSEFTVISSPVSFDSNIKFSSILFTKGEYISKLFSLSPMPIVFITSSLYFLYVTLYFFNLSDIS